MFWTDYPFTALGDTPGQEAPVRPCQVIGYDGDKYCKIAILGSVMEVKRGYIYRREGRCGDAPALTHDDIVRALREKP